jgi:hypothetical protein
MSDKKALQCLLDFAVTGVGYWGDMARSIGVTDETIDKYIFEALAAIDSADENTVVLITGKGRETRQKRGVKYIDTPSDVEYVEAALAEK